MHDGEPVLNIYPNDVITIRTTKSEYKTRKIVLTVGPWASKMLPRLGIHLPIQVRFSSDVSALQLLKFVGHNQIISIQNGSSGPLYCYTFVFFLFLLKFSDLIYKVDVSFRNFSSNESRCKLCIFEE